MTQDHPETPRTDLIDRTALRAAFFAETWRPGQVLGQVLALIDDAPRAATEPRTFDDDETWDWGIVIDALVEHRASAEARKGENPESSSDVRADICKRMIEAIVADADARYQRVAAPRAATEPHVHNFNGGYCYPCPEGRTEEAGDKAEAPRHE